MREDVKRAWTAALRSGEYIQGNGALVHRIPEGAEGEGETRHCCLGVLSDLAAKEGVVERVEDLDGTPYGYRSPGTLIENAALPSAVSVWAGLDTDSPTVKWDGRIEARESCLPPGEDQAYLTAYNDHVNQADYDGSWNFRHEYPFSAIADMIDRDL